MGMEQDPVPLVKIQIAATWMFISQQNVSIGMDP